MSNRGIHRTRLHSSAAGFSLTELMVVLAFMGALAAIATPMIAKALAAMRLTGAGRTLSNATAVAKTRGAALFTRARLYVDKGTQSFHVEYWDSPTNQWVVDGGTTTLPANVTFSWAAVTAPPANTQSGGINQALVCRDNASPSNAIANTACIEFNSRGIPIDEINGFTPTDKDALYISDGDNVVGVTVAATGLMGMWTTPSSANPAWTIL